MTKTGSQKKFKISIRAKILVGMIVCVLTVTNLIGWFFIVQARDTLLEQCKKNARNSAKIAAERIIKLKKKLNTILSKRTGQSLRKIERDTERDHYLDSKEALNYGLVDKIL